MNTDHERLLIEAYRRFNWLAESTSTADYVDLNVGRGFEGPDPVAQLQRTIRWTEGATAQLFSGFRGTGKTTELQRLRRELTADGAPFVVLYVNANSYLNLSTPIDVSDFLMAVAGGVDEALRASDKLAERPSTESVWTRFAHFMRKTQVDLNELGLSTGPELAGVTLKANLKADPTFKQRLQRQMAGHLGALTDEVHGFIQECVERVRSGWGPDWQLVVLFDSLEQLRGANANETEVADSAVTVFQTHAEKLHLPGVHVVYTVPPWLKIRAPAVASMFHESAQIPCVKVREPDGAPFQPGLDALTALVERRMPAWPQVFGERAVIEQLALDSGGYLRDLLRLMQGVLRQCAGQPLPAGPALVARARADVRNSYLPLTVEDARWLVNIADTHEIDLSDTARLGKLARLYDNLLVMTYRNGKEWVNAHPLVIDEARAMVARNPLPPAQSA